MKTVTIETPYPEIGDDFYFSAHSYSLSIGEDNATGKIVEVHGEDGFTHVYVRVTWDDDHEDNFYDLPQFFWDEEKKRWELR